MMPKIRTPFEYIIGVVVVSMLLLFSALAHADAVDVAIAEIGNGEIGADNKGVHVRKYTKGLESSWCAGFVSYVLSQSGKDSLGYIVSARQYWNKGLRVKDPKRGDVICFWRGDPKGWQGHVGIVESVSGEKITVIEGNRGSYPAKVKRVQYTLGKIPKLLGFIRP